MEIEKFYSYELAYAENCEWSVDYNKISTFVWLKKYGSNSDEHLAYKSVTVEEIGCSFSFTICQEKIKSL